jgi:hypothetical protein
MNFDAAALSVTRGSVYYDAIQSASEIDFVPLVLSYGASLDDRKSVLAWISEDEPQSSGTGVAVMEPPAAPARRSSQRRSSSAEGRRRSTLLFRQRLEETPKVLDLPAGYPGHLTEEELETCLAFRKRLQEGEPIRREMVYCFKDVEGEAYSLCRYLRARKFDIDEIMKLIDKHRTTWMEGSAHNFFPDASDAIGGAPESALLSQFPLILGKIARNGCPIVYFSTRQINIDGMECVTSLDDIRNYMWHFTVHKFKNLISVAKAADPSLFIRMQIMAVVDLKGLKVSTLKRAMGALQGALGILSVFPKFLFNVCILNAPTYFAAFWPAIKAFMDPATAKKVELYGNETKGRHRLLELVESASLASDFGGTGLSTAEIVMQQGAGFENSRKSRQIVKLIKIHRDNEVKCDLEIEDDELASICIYTRAKDGADILLYKRNEKVPLKRVALTRNEGEPADKAFFRNVVTALHGPGAYRVVVNSQPNASPDYFLFLADVSKADTSPG